MTLSACGNSVAETEAKPDQNLSSETSQTGEVEVASTPVESPAATRVEMNDQDQARALAARWGFDGFIRCGYYIMRGSAEAIRANDPTMIENMKFMANRLPPVKDLVNPVPDMSLIEGALKVFVAEHGQEPTSVFVSEFAKCGNDLTATRYAT